MPTFSVAIPTRNRAHLLAYALRSALAQTFDDYEIVVSDNFSTDDTARVVREMADPRVSYVNTGRSLAFHDSWEFALEHASGDYVMFLGDDDAMHPRLFSLLSSSLRKNPLDIVCWRRCHYHHPSHPVAELRNVLGIPLFSGKLIHAVGAEELRVLFDLHNRDSQPKVVNSICSRKLIERIRKTVGRFFLPPAPAYTAAVFQLAHTQDYLFIDYPLCLAGQAAESSSAAIQMRGSNLQVLKEEFKLPVFEKVPLSGQIVTNFLAESLLRAAAALDGKLSDYPLNWERYFISYRNELLRMRHGGRDVKKELKEFWHVISQRGLVWRMKMLRRAFTHGLKRAWRPPTQVVDPNSFIRGDERGFANIYECAQKLEELCPNAHRS